MKEKYKNGHGIVIKQCCASCIHCGFDKVFRICMKGHGHVAPYDPMCDEWEIKPGLLRAGRGDGKVKNPEYLRYLLAENDRENLSLEERSVSAVRARYTAQGGKIYL
jgi:hypothetical protein